MIELDKLLLDASPDAIIATTPDGKVSYWTRGAESVFGFTSTEAMGKFLHDLIVPSDRIEEEHRIQQLTLETGFASHESLRQHKDRSLIFVDITSKAIRNPQGKIEFILSSKKDVTQIKAQRDARYIKARFGDLLESIPDGIVMVNASGRIVFSNAQAGILFGYPEEELLGKPVEILLPARLRQAHVGHRSLYIAQPRVRAMGVGLELFGLRKDGTEFPVEISLSPLETEEGTLVSSAIRDITERKQFEKVLQEKNLELINANQAKDHFLASMSHELRTPLNAIIGFTGTLLMELPGPLTADQKKQLETVRTSARHLLSLITDLLDLARIEAGKVVLHPTTFDCSEVIEEVASGLRPLAETKCLGFSTRLPAGTMSLHCDRRALTQILINLTSNAIKFTERGEVCISAGRNQEGIEISVRDTGVGIRPEDQQRLFAAFTQVMGRRHQDQEGSGLGLYLSRKLAEILGGEIRLISEYGKGSTFTLVLRG